VPACRQENGEHRFDRSRPESLELSRLLEVLTRCDGSEREYFLAQCRLEGGLADVADDVPLPDYLSNSGIELVSLWMAATGTVTHFHSTGGIA
jgi:hypothetical protein